MTIRMTAVLAASIASLALTGPSRAADTFAIDPGHTNVIFSVNHLGYSNMFGQFNDVSGEFVFDEGNVANSSVTVTVQTKSVDTDHDKRDDHLRSPDFFNAAEFPEMTFVSKKIEKTGDKSGKITGDLTLLGVTKPVTLDVTFNKVAPHPIPSYKGVVFAGFSAQGAVKRSDFGMKYGVPGLGDDIKFWIEVEGSKK